MNELETASQNDFNLFWKTLKNLTDDLNTETNSENLPKNHEWYSHFEQLHCDHHLSEEQEKIIGKLKQKENSKNLLNELDMEITTEEIIKTAKKIKSKKTAHSDKINNEMIKYSVDILANGFIKVFNTIMKSGKFPTSWCEGLISPIFKSGNKLDPSNYQGICVSSSLGKFFCSVLHERLMNFSKTKELLHPSQIGFLPNNRTADHIFTLKTLHDKYVNQNNEKIYACFIDFKKAFDSVWHEDLYLKLLENGIGGCFYDLIKDLYSNTRCAVKVSGHRTPFFSYNRGVCQGCVLSPVLFNLYINELPNLFEKVNPDPFLLPNGTRLSSLLYVDDLVILSRSKSGLQNCLDSLNEWSKKWLMNINLKKTEVMILQKHKLQSLDFFLGDKRIDITNKYTYLGLTPNTKFSVATQQLSEKAMHALFKIRKNLDFQKLTPKLAIKIFDDIVSPILLYNSEVWGAYGNNDFTKWDKTSTEKTHLKFCKLYLGVNRKASNITSRGELDPNQRRLFSKFCISHHKLEIEFGRYSDVPRQERLCKYCDKLAVEDEFHFSFECEKYQNLQNNSRNILKNYFQMSITDELKRKLLSDLMSLNDPVITGMEEVSLISFLKRVPLFKNTVFPMDAERYVLAERVLDVLMYEDKDVCEENKTTAEFFVSYIKEVELRKV
ncbi:Hypothetical predicted protein, partial [Paramuricea clavata]